MGVRLPSEYQEVEYIGWTSADSELFLNTLSDVSTRGDLAGYAFECILSHLSSKNGVAQNICIGFGDGAAQYIGVNSNRVGLGTSYQLNAAVNPNDKNTYIFQSHGSYAELSCDEYSVSRTTGTDQALNARLFVGSRYSANSGAGRFYWCKLSKDETVISTFIPCYQKSDQRCGVYDITQKVFYPAAVSWTKGPDVIDSISPWLVARRRGLMKEPELYPVGTNIRAKYGAVFVSKHTIDTITGEYVENSSGQASPVYMLISPKYTYWKRGTFPNRTYLSVLAFYDKDKNYISYYRKNDYSDFVIPDIPSNARYARIAIPSGSYNDVKIIRTA